MSKLILAAPLQGWSTPLDELPDEVFAGRMLGDGLAIDPTSGVLYAPCDGELITVAPSRHAMTLRTEGGAEILLHVGIDTVGLGGAGFELHVREGARVRAGDRLLSFDLDLLAQRAKSVLTPVVVLESSGFAIVRRHEGRAVEVGEPLMELVPAAELAPDARARLGAAGQAGVSEPAASAAAVAGTGVAAAGVAGAGIARPDFAGPAGAPGGVMAARRVRVALEHGIHARPAALLSAAIKPFSVDVSVTARGRTVNGRSTVALMGLGVRRGDEIEIRASGADAVAALGALEAVLLGPSGSEAAAPAESGAAGSGHTARNAHAAGKGSMATVAGPHGRPAVDAEAPQPATPAGVSGRRGPADGALRGVIANPGLAVGVAVRLGRAEIQILSEAGAGVAHENSELDRARAAVKAELERMSQTNSGPAREIVAAHAELLDDPDLVSGARQSIARGKSASYAWRQVIRANIEVLRGLDDRRMAERVDDLLDLESQVLAALQPAGASSSRELPEGAILIASELLPSQFVAIDASRVAGICMAAGGPTSHVSILAAAMGIPTLVAMGPELLEVADGTRLVLDAEQGALEVAPPPARLAAAQAHIARRRESRAAEQAAAQRECRTADGVRVEVFANVGSVAEAQAAVRNGAEGCGLLRTEFLFLDRQSPPDQAEQADQYQQIAHAFGERPVTIRTLDIGGDKPIPYLPLPREENPALGWRGVRTSLWRPDLLEAQLRALLAVRPFGQCRILLPMITDAAEIRTIRTMLEDLRREIGRDAPIQIGVMIETPASALIADRLAALVDFFSIGTNDLTQYTLAMDRGHSELAARLDALHPAVLSLIDRTVTAARAHGRPVAVCGGLASDPVAAPILVGLGVHELSVVPAVVPRIKAVVSDLSMDECTRVAREALEQETAEAVRARAMKLVANVGSRAAAGG